MKKANVVIGKTYAVKVSGRVVPVRLIEELTRGWTGKNLVTGHFVHVKTAARLRYEIRH